MADYQSLQPWGGGALTPAQRINLAGSVEYHVSHGWRVESAPMPGQVVVVQGKRPNHILHLLLSVVTFGLWLPVWLLVALSSQETRAVLTAHPDGSVTNSLQAAAAQRAAEPWWREHSTVVAIVIVVAIVVVMANVS